jgi:hypothetical protein
MKKSVEFIKNLKDRLDARVVFPIYGKGLPVGSQSILYSRKSGKIDHAVVVSYNTKPTSYKDQTARTFDVSEDLMTVATPEKIDNTMRAMDMFAPQNGFKEVSNDRFYDFLKNVRS